MQSKVEKMGNLLVQCRARMAANHPGDRLLGREYRVGEGAGVARAQRRGEARKPERLEKGVAM